MQLGIVMSTQPPFWIMWSTPQVPPFSPSSATLNHFRPEGEALAALSTLALRMVRGDGWEEEEEGWCDVEEIGVEDSIRTCRI